MALIEPWQKFPIAFFLLGALISTAYAQVPEKVKRDNFRVGHAAGSFVMAADFLQAVAESRCGYVLRKRPPSVADRVAEVRQYLNPQQDADIRRFLASVEFKELQANSRATVKKMVDAFSGELDQKTACGMVVATVMCQVDKGEEAWKAFAKSRGAVPTN